MIKKEQVLQQDRERVEEKQTQGETVQHGSERMGSRRDMPDVAGAVTNLYDMASLQQGRVFSTDHPAQHTGTEHWVFSCFGICLDRDTTAAVQAINQTETRPGHAASTGDRRSISLGLVDQG